MSFQDFLSLWDIKYLQQSTGLTLREVSDILISLFSVFKEF